VLFFYVLNVFFSIKSSTSFSNSNEINSLVETMFTSSSSSKDSIIFLNFKTLSNSFTSISLSGSWIDFKRFSRDEIPSGNPIWLKVLAAASLTGISLSKR